MYCLYMVLLTAGGCPHGTGVALFKPRAGTKLLLFLFGWHCQHFCIYDKIIQSPVLSFKLYRNERKITRRRVDEDADSTYLRRT